MKPIKAGFIDSWEFQEKCGQNAGNFAEIGWFLNALKVTWQTVRPILLMEDRR